MQEFNPENLLIKTGFAELYEYENPEENLTGKFVTFSKDNPGKIVAAKPNDYILGAVTISPLSLSNESYEWQGKYLKNEYGDTYIAQRDIARGIKQYDTVAEMEFIATVKDVDFSGVVNPNFDHTKQYERRQIRNEWACVTLLGQVIVIDNGTCKPGEFCELFKGKAIDKRGTVVPAKAKTATTKFYVLNRISETTVTILIK